MKKEIKDIAIGAFDGMHLGHKALFRRLDENGAIVVIQKHNATITPGRYRCEYVNKPCFFYDIKDIKDLDAKSFVDMLKKDFPNLKKIVVGYDFAFGKDRKYSIKDLKRYFDGIVEVVDEVKKDGISVHSRVIREFIKSGDIKRSNSLLGHTFKIVGKVIKGQGLGKERLYPTINIDPNSFILPKEGVYATITNIDGFYKPSVTFIGNRLSTDKSFSIETHIIKEDIKNLPKKIEILFLDRIRDVKKFNSLDELKKEIQNDIKKALKIIKEHTI